MEPESKPLKENLFGSEGGRAFLVGSKCRACGRIFFPARSQCLECGGETMEATRFGNKGTLYSYAVSHMPSEHFEPPYMAGWIEAEEGIRVFAPLRVKEGRSPEIGASVALTIAALWRKGDTPVMGYAYEII